MTCEWRREGVRERDTHGGKETERRHILETLRRETGRQRDRHKKRERGRERDGQREREREKQDRQLVS